jgi:hypothetical protein
MADSVRTQCPSGHPYDGIDSRGARICHPCMCAANRRARANRKAGIPTMTPIPLADRLWAKVNRVRLFACWNWTSPAESYPGGYGVIGLGGTSGKRTLAHRAAWEVSEGPIPEGMWVLHRCDNPKCCNPMHLFLGTALDNNRDAFAKGRNSRDEMGRFSSPVVS